MIHLESLKIFEDTRVESFIVARRRANSYRSAAATRDPSLKDLSDDLLGFSLSANKASFRQ